MSLLIKRRNLAASPLEIHQGGSEPAPYTGTYIPYRWMTIRPHGELYLGLLHTGALVYTSSVYQTLDYGNNWTKILDENDFGGVKHQPVMVLPVAGGYYLCLVYDMIGSPGAFRVYRAASLAGPWVNVYGSTGYNGIWYPSVPDMWRDTTGDRIWIYGCIYHFLSASNKVLRISANGGAGWTEYLTTADYPVGESIRVKADLSHGFATADYPVDNWTRYSDAPTGGGWGGMAGPPSPRAGAIGVNWPNVVIMQGNNIYLSTDNGHTFPVSKGVPAGMQGGDYENGIDMSSQDPNLLLCAPNFGGAGVWRSTDQGDNWTKVLATIGAGSGMCRPRVYFDPDNDDRAFAFATLGFFRSDDKGVTWYPRSRGLETGQVP